MDNNKSFDLKTLEELRQNAGKQIDKLLVYLPSGGLVLSLAFTKDVVSIDCSNEKWMLILTWCLFAFSLIVVLVSQFSSFRAIELLLKKDVKTRKLHIFTKYLNYLALASLVFGVVLFVIYVSINI